MNRGDIVPNNHGLTDEKIHHSVCGEVKESIHKVLKKLKGCVYPHASKNVRLATGLVMYDENQKVEIPSLYTK